MGRHLRRLALVALMILATLAAPLAVPIRIVVLKRRRLEARTELVARSAVRSTWLPETA